MVLIQLKSMECGINATIFETYEPIFAKNILHQPLRLDLSAEALKTR